MFIFGARADQVPHLRKERPQLKVGRAAPRRAASGAGPRRLPRLASLMAALGCAFALHNTLQKCMPCLNRPIVNSPPSLVCCAVVPRSPTTASCTWST